MSLRTVLSLFGLWRGLGRLQKQAEHIADLQDAMDEARTETSDMLEIEFPVTVEVSDSPNPPPREENEAQADHLLSVIGQLRDEPLSLSMAEAELRKLSSNAWWFYLLHRDEILQGRLPPRPAPESRNIGLGPY